MNEEKFDQMIKSSEQGDLIQTYIRLCEINGDTFTISIRRVIGLLRWRKENALEKDSSLLKESDSPWRVAHSVLGSAEKYNEVYSYLIKFLNEKLSNLKYKKVIIMEMYLSSIFINIPERIRNDIEDKEIRRLICAFEVDKSINYQNSITHFQRELSKINNIFLDQDYFNSKLRPILMSSWRSFTLGDSNSYRKDFWQSIESLLIRLIGEDINSSILPKKLIASVRSLCKEHRNYLSPNQNKLLDHLGVNCSYFFRHRKRLMLELLDYIPEKVLLKINL